MIMNDQAATTYTVDYPHPTQQRITLFLLAVVAIFSLGVLADLALNVIRGLQSYNACVAQTQGAGDCSWTTPDPGSGWIIVMPTLVVVVQAFVLRGGPLCTSPEGL